VGKPSCFRINSHKEQSIRRQLVIHNHRLLIKNDIIMISVASARYEFEGFTENVVEL